MNIEVSSEFFLSKEQLTQVREVIESYHKGFQSLAKAEAWAPRSSEELKEQELDAIDLAYRPLPLTVIFNLDPLTGSLNPVEIKKNGQ